VTIAYKIKLNLKEIKVTLFQNKGTFNRYNIVCCAYRSEKQLIFLS